MVINRKILPSAMLVLMACGPAQPTPTIITEDGSDLPLVGLADSWRERFVEGDRLFDLPFRNADGLGPYYIRQSCASCHQGGGRGPGFVEKMAQVQADGVTPVMGQPLMSTGHTLRPFMSAGASTPFTVPAGGSVRVTQRSGIPILGHGYVEAISDAEIERVEREQAARTDGISGRINRVTYPSQRNTESTFANFEFGQTGLIGRFGLKARQATIDDFTADAFQGDMGLTSPMRPTEPANPERLTDDDKPGVDVDLKTVNAVADYIRLLEIPRRTMPGGNGAALFSMAGCDVCHVSTMKTRADYPIAQLADREAPVYSDLLLHDMGPSLADGLEDESATSREWRTAPLIGLRFVKSFLHDSRASSIEEAIVLHGAEGSEARGSVLAFQALGEEDRAAVVAFVSSL